MSIRITLSAVLSLCAVLLTFSITSWAQSPSQTDSSEMRPIYYHNASVKTVLKKLGNSLGLNVVFDESVKDDQWVSILLKELTVESAMKIVLIQQNLAAGLTKDDTITVFLDNNENRQKFAEYNQWPGKRDIDFALEASDQRKLQEFKFINANFKTVLNTLVTSLKLNVVFDHQVEVRDNVTIDLRDMTTEKAIEIILSQKKYQARIIEKNTIIVFPDNSINRNRYEEYKPWPL